MIQPTFAAPENFTASLNPETPQEQQWYLFSEKKLLVSANGKSLPACPLFDTKKNLYMGAHGEKNIFTAFAVENAPEGWAWRDLRDLHGVLSRHQFSLAGRALQLLHWESTNQYCGRCGSKTVHRSHERCLECPSCGHLSYPKLAPVVMALVKRENKILLARGPHFPPKMYSVLAGYVDPGETLEQCVAREVFEEVGIKVGNIRYFGSQPWPFTHAFMIAFTCDWQEGEIRIDPAEIEEAAWFEKSALPEVPSSLSIARLLIDS